MIESFKMKTSKKKTSISSPDELNKHLQYTSVFTWITLGATIVALSIFFAWSCLYTIQDKILCKLVISSHEATLVIEESDKSRLAVGQKIYVLDKVGEILSFNDGNPVISSFDLEDNSYTCKIVVKEMHPIDFLIK